jgi:LacI family transcriptional regulator
MKKHRRGIHLIAEIANVSIGTVDRALHGRPGINEATRQRILKIAEQIAYTPNLAARALSVSKASARIGVCIPREIHFFYDQLWSGILDEARSVAPLGIQFIHRPVHALGEGDTDAFRELAESGVDGIIVTAGNPQGLTPLIDIAEAKGMRVVCVSTDAPASKRSSIVCVEPSLNGHLAGELMGKFVPPGSVVAVIAGMLSAEDHRKKTAGFSEAFPLHCPGGQIATVIEGHEDEDESFQKTFDLLGRMPTLAGLYVNTVNCLPVSCPRRPRPGRKNQANHYRPLWRDVPLLRKRDDHRVHLPTAAPSRAARGKAAGGSSDQQSPIPGEYSPQPRSCDVVKPPSIPRDKAGQRPFRRLSAKRRYRTSRKAG